MSLASSRGVIARWSAAAAATGSETRDVTAKAGTADRARRASAIILYQSSPTASHSRGSRVSRCAATPSPPFSKRTRQSPTASSFTALAPDRSTPTTGGSAPPTHSSDLCAPAAVRSTKSAAECVLSPARLSARHFVARLTAAGSAPSRRPAGPASSVMVSSSSTSASTVRFRSASKQRMASTRTLSSRSLKRDRRADPTP
mmetsp:Transcript_26606/g.52999  ORF Transcript_26606/g.52999 Transcript_26606/m.52999 type:complete len:201 (-) Transcript_26606:491-1093(-)